MPPFDLDRSAGVIVDVVRDETPVHFVIDFANDAHDHHRVEFEVFVDEAIVGFGMFRIENRGDGARQHAFHRRTLQCERHVCLE